MTIDEVNMRIQAEVESHTASKNVHRLILSEIITDPRNETILLRSLKAGVIADQRITVWVVGEEDIPGGYSVVMREDGAQFGLASPGFTGEPLVLDGWYGSSLESAFLAM